MALFKVFIILFRYNASTRFSRFALNLKFFNRGLRVYRSGEILSDWSAMVEGRFVGLIINILLSAAWTSMRADVLDALLYKVGEYMYRL